MSEEESSAGIESRISAPDLSCPKCNNLLPNGLGIITCVMCKSEVKVEHQGTRKRWREEPGPEPRVANVTSKVQFAADLANAKQGAGGGPGHDPARADQAVPRHLRRGVPPAGAHA